MRHIPLALALLLAGAFAAEPALAQRRDKDKIIENPSTGNEDNDVLADLVMRRTLPFREAQMLKYFSNDGKYEGYAVRRHRTIRFYDPQGMMVARAERVSQAQTNYYAPDGTRLGRRMHQKMTMANTAKTAEGKGFINLYELKQPTEAK